MCRTGWEKREQRRLQDERVSPVDQLGHVVGHAKNAGFMTATGLRRCCERMETLRERHPTEITGRSVNQAQDPTPSQFRSASSVLPQPASPVPSSPSSADEEEAKLVCLGAIMGGL